jgi:hypothetical protein
MFSDGGMGGEGELGGLIGWSDVEWVFVAVD